MRIAVNTRLLLKDKLEGIGWFTYHTLKRMVISHPEHEFIFFFDRPYDASFVFAANVKPVVVQPPARHPLLFIAWFDLSIPLLLKIHKADVFLSPDGQMSLVTSVPTCLVMHDLAFEHFPAHLVLSQRMYWKHFSPKFAKKACRIVTVSEFTKADIVKRYKIPAAKLDVACNGASDLFRPLGWDEKEKTKAEFARGNEYFVYAGAIHPRKNIINLLKAFIRFKKHHRSNMKLVIVGRMAWKSEELEKFKLTMPNPEEVLWYGYLPTEDLARIVGSAYALVYPSLFEGFGIPILEAFQCGVPAVVSNTSSMPEIAGAAALLANPEDPEDIAAQMGKIYRDEKLRNQLIAAAPTQVAKYNWDKAAEVLWHSVVKCVNKQQS